MKWLIVTIYLSAPCDQVISNQQFDTQAACLKAAQNINHEFKPDATTCIKATAQSIEQMKQNAKLFRGKKI